MINLDHFNSLTQIFRNFRDKATCFQFIEEQRYPDGEVACPYCGGMHPYRRGDGRFKCRECGSSFSILQGSIFQDTKLPLYKWFGAIFLMSVHSKGVSLGAANPSCEQLIHVPLDLQSSGSTRTSDL